MNVYKRHPLFASLLTLMALVVLVELFFVFRLRGEARAAGALLQQRQEELQRLINQRPAPSLANQRAIAENLAEAEAALEAMRASLRGTGDTGRLLAQPPPATRTDAFFEIATFVERTREKAAVAQVAIRADERFSFASHINEGPEIEAIPMVHRQRLVIGYLLDTLFAADPTELVSIQREAPPRRQAPGGLGPPPGAPPGAAGDFFAIDPAITARVPGLVDTLAFRVTFQGQTGALRRFLNRLAEFEIPIVVRSVEVEAIGTEGRPAVGAGAFAATPLQQLFGVAPTAGAPAQGPVPIVAQNLSRFTVTVEFLRPVGDQAPTPAS
jgi:hypothetical protein